MAQHVELLFSRLRNHVHRVPWNYMHSIKTNIKNLENGVKQFIRKPTKGVFHLMDLRRSPIIVMRNSRYVRTIQLPVDHTPVDILYAVMDLYCMYKIALKSRIMQDNIDVKQCSKLASYCTRSIRELAKKHVAIIPLLSHCTIIAAHEYNLNLKCFDLSCVLVRARVLSEMLHSF